MHYLGSDIRGKTPEQLAYGEEGRRARSSAATTRIRWVPEAEVVPPGSRPRPSTSRRPPSDRERPIVVHAPSSRRRKGSEHVIAACEGLDVELELVEGLHHDEALKRYRAADIVVDQLNAGWYGLFAIEAMALGKPVVTFLHDEAVAPDERGVRDSACRSSPPAPRRCRGRCGRSSRTRPGGAARRREPRLRRAACTTSRGSPTACSTSTLVSSGLGPQMQMRRSGKHSAVYGLGGLVSRLIAVFLLPLYTRYLEPRTSAQSDVVASTRCS